ncbi:DUF2309 domain-containing protein [Rubripirellula amarantea]|nr:DUF2309 domain-containing protein [Rubripirellula amarantea]
MPVIEQSKDSHVGGTSKTDLYEAIRGAVDHAAHLLPAQGPITVFVHHNTLHAFEHLNFDAGVQAGGRLFNCHAYLPEDRYQAELARGRIRVEDLDAVLQEDLGDEADRLVATFGTRYALRLAMMQFPLHSGPPHELRWVVAETDALRKFRQEVDPVMRENLITQTRKWCLDLLDGAPGNSSEIQRELVCDLERCDAHSWELSKWEPFTLKFLWRVCCAGVTTITNDDGGAVIPSSPRRHRDILLDQVGEDSDQNVHDVLIRYCSMFLDQGFADWDELPRDIGFYDAFLHLYCQRLAAPTRWMSSLQTECRRLKSQNVGPLDSIAQSLVALGVDAEEYESYITHSLLALRGWAGMVWQMETNADWAPRPAAKGSLVEFLAIRLLLDRLSITQVVRDSLDDAIPLDQVRQRIDTGLAFSQKDRVEQRAFNVFQLAQVRGWLPRNLQSLTREQWRTLVSEIEAFGSLDRRRIYHRAYERKYRNETLDAIISHGEHTIDPLPEPKFVLVTCIDDREESFRRHVEEVEPNCETVGIAGFYGTAMYYRGAEDAHFKPLCPVSIKPKHYVIEEPLYSLSEVERRRSQTRKRIGAITHRTHLGTRSLLGGLVTTLAGSLAAFPLVGRILFPRTVARLRSRLHGIIEPPSTQLRYERLDPDPGSQNGKLGFSVDEMASIVENTLRSAGMTHRWSKLIVFLGHGSTSLNNPHESAYNCGACAGSRGGPNARAFALMANDHRVRNRLVDRGLSIPDDTWFVGGYHDTTNDSVTFADLDRLPVSHRAKFESLVEVIDEARQRNAHERCRRFESAPLDISFKDALEHVEDRPEDLSQARPEYNHATNSLCLVGRRSWSRGLFLDRRSFLTSYDPSQDDEQGSILEGILRAAIPVCAGISLEYYFSTVDVEGYGCGSKLPHNITSLLGVMSGSASDLRPGLSAQMVEIHEPMRILFVIETTQEIMNRIVANNPAIKQLIQGGWVQLAILNSETSHIHRYVRGEFVVYAPHTREIPVVGTSINWYRNHRDHLGFATVEASLHPTIKTEDGRS